MPDPLPRGDGSKRRILAFGFDNLIATALSFLAVAVLRLESAPAVASVVILMYLAYFFGFEAAWSRTPAKAMFGLRIQRLDGTDCAAAGALIRTLLRLVEANPLLLGGLPASLAILASKRRQRLGDRLAGTLVLRHPPPPPEPRRQPALPEELLAEFD